MNSESRLSLTSCEFGGLRRQEACYPGHSAAIMPFCIGQEAYFFSSWAANVCATIFPSRITKVSVANVAL